MIKRRQIHPQVQKALYRKIDAINRQQLTDEPIPTGKNFFIGGALEPQDNSSPIEQQMYRSCFARVSVAVPEEIQKGKDDSTIVHQPINISSYLKRDENNIFQVNQPVTFQQGFEESDDNRFRGHSGITSIKASQQEFYTYKYTIGWVCPDPIFFEETFEPNFLKLGAYCAIEFGWGINDKGIEVEDLTIEEMINILDNGVQDRNLKSAGNYQCGVGTVTNFDWKIQENGVYAGDLTILSMGASPLLETQSPGNSSDEANVARLKNLTEKLAIGRQLAKDGLLEDSDKEELQDTLREVIKLQSNTVTFQSAMKNLDAVMDTYLGLANVDAENIDDATTKVLAGAGAVGGAVLGAGFPPVQLLFGSVLAAGGAAIGATLDWLNAGKAIEKVIEFASESLRDSSDILQEENNPYSIFNFEKIAKKNGIPEGLSFTTGATRFKDDTTNESSRIDYIFKDGLLRIKPIDLAFQSKNKIPEKLKHRYFASWGWFEDIILGSFFNLSSGDTTIQKIRSVDGEGKVNGLGLQMPGEQNKCLSHEFLFSMGLDSVILPKKQHPILMNGFNDFTLQELKAARVAYPKEERHNMTRIYHIYNLIDRLYKPFEVDKQNQITNEPSEKAGPNGEKLILNSKGQYYYIEEESGNAVIIPRRRAGRVGNIRNMVFPLEMFQKHFSEMNSLRQGMRNFWADVTNQYGGYWDFKIGQDADKTNVIGVSDLNLSEPKQPARFENLSGKEDYYDFINTKPDPEKTFVFSVFSKDSIVTSFDISLDLSAEAATIARYGSNTSQAKLNGVDVLAIKAWSLINNTELAEDVKDQQEQKRLEKFKNLEVYKDLRYPTDDGVGQGYITDNYDSESSSFTARPLRDNKGLRFGNIKTIKEDDAKQAERIENQRIQFIKGVGIYDKFGNFSQYFKGTMNYIINSSLEDGSESLIQTSEPLLPVTLSMELDGIGGLRVGDLFKVDYLPVKYRDFCYFMITKIDHNIESTGWSTSIEAAMIADLPLFWTGKKNVLNRPVNFMEWFKSTTFDLETLITDSDSPLLTNVQEKIDPFQKQIADINFLAFGPDSKYEKIINETNEEKTGLFGGFFKEKAQSARRATRISALKTRIRFNIRQMNNTFDRLEQKLSALGDIKLTYTDFLGAQKTTTANELIALCEKQKADVIKKLVDIELFYENEPVEETGPTTTTGVSSRGGYTSGGQKYQT